MPGTIQSARLSIRSLTLLAALALAACSPQKNIVPAVLPDAVRLNTIAVMPYVDMYRIYGDNVSFNCPLCGRSEVIDVVSSDAAAFLTDTLFDMLQQRGGYQLIPPGKAEGVLSTILLDPQKKVPDLDVVLTIGRQLGADAVLLGRVYRFREREGDAFSAQTPAAVTFDLLLIYVPDGQLLWEGHYSERQQPLSENLYKFKSFLDRKGKWLSARELASSGLQEELAAFPEKR
jgi:hypothetical protein